jgi:uncharacterized repeat protein (TIGR01451 family)
MRKILCVLFFFLITLNGFSQTSIYISSANDSVPPCYMDTSHVGDRTFNLHADLTGYATSDSFLVQTFFGDGAYQTIPAHPFMNGGQLQLSVQYYHTYLDTGIFDVTYIVTGTDGNADTLFHPAEVIRTVNCAVLTLRVFIDNNSDCIFNSGDNLINVPVTIYNGVSTYATEYFGGASIAFGVNYTAFIDTASVHQLGYILSCPISGMVNFTSNWSNTIFFALSCTNSYDLSVTSSGHPFKIGNSALVNVVISAVSCLPQSGAYTLNLDPSMSFVYAETPPSSGGGLNYSWNYTNLSSFTPGINNMMYCNLNPGVQIGDTLCYSFSVTPIGADTNPADNIITPCYTVLSAWDPNYKDVYPKGTGPSGDILPGTQLTYTIGFQNTGNDTATNVYILDTLDGDLDINTIQIVYASHPMQFYIVNGNILRFEFNNIQLPDSGHNQLLSHGFVVYKINPKQNLTDGIQLINSAGIYFDWNPAVVTNATLNTINSTLVGINELSLATVSVYPNPFSDKLSIAVQKQNFKKASFSIKNLLGQFIYSDHFIDRNTKTIDLDFLSKGIYFLELTIDGERIVKKIMKD